MRQMHLKADKEIELERVISFSYHMRLFQSGYWDSTLEGIQNYTNSSSKIFE